MRAHLFEFEDLPWFPDFIRVGGTDYLRYLLKATRLYDPIIPVIQRTLSTTTETHIVDMCSGGGGAMEHIHKALMQKSDGKIQITLTDKFPNVNAFDYIQQKAGKGLDYISYSVDATQMPSELKGLRTMFSAIHHFKPNTVKGILQDAANNNSPIGIFDGADKNLFVILGMIIFHPIAFILFTPFFKPFRFTNLLFTYVIPLIPLYTVWDGCVSIIRLYRHEELLQLAKEINAPGFVWESGKLKGKFGIHATYLIGYPVNKNKI
jgi:hypothetical protein